METTLIIIFTLSAYCLSAQNIFNNKVFPVQDKKEFFFETEVYPWISNGYDFKLGYLNKTHTFGLRHFAFDLNDKTSIYEGAEAHSDNIDLRCNYGFLAEYQYSFYKNFYVGLWLVYQDWTKTDIINNTEFEQTNLLITPQAGYKWIFLKHCYLNLGMRYVHGINLTNDGFLNDELDFKSFTIVPTVSIGFKHQLFIKN